MLSKEDAVLSLTNSCMGGELGESKFVSAGRQNQHAENVRYPIFRNDLGV